MLPFDPYYAWFGIPPQEQPPNLYRLLALSPGEADPARILGAIERTQKLLEPHLYGQQRMEAERLLAEVSAARSVLMNPASKASYDSQLSVGSSRSSSGESGGFKRPAPRGAGPNPSPSPADTAMRGPLPMNAPPGMSPPAAAPMATLAPAPVYPQSYGYPAPGSYPAQPTYGAPAYPPANYPGQSYPQPSYPQPSYPVAPNYGYAAPIPAAPAPGYAPPWSAPANQSAPAAFVPPVPPPASDLQPVVEEAHPPEHPADPFAAADAAAAEASANSMLATYLAIGIGGVLAISLVAWVAIGELQSGNHERHEEVAHRPTTPVTPAKQGELPKKIDLPASGNASTPVGGKTVEFRNPDKSKGDLAGESAVEAKTPTEPKAGEGGDMSSGSKKPGEEKTEEQKGPPVEPKNEKGGPSEPAASPAAPVLAGLPAAVDLPAIGDAAAASVLIGNVTLAENQTLQARLVDGSGGRGSSAFKLSPAPAPAKTTWLVEAVEGESAGKIGEVKLEKNELQFAWSPNIDPAKAGPLRNAKLWLAVGAERKAISLRKPIEVEPLLFAIEPVQIRHQIPGLPDASDIGLEFLGDEGAPRHRFEPAKVHGSKEADVVFTSDTNSKLLVFRIQLSRPGAGQMKIDTRTMAVAGLKLIAFKAANIEKELTLIRQHKVNSTEQFLQFQQANRRNRALVDQGKILHDKEMAAADQQIVALDQLASIAAEDKQAKFHYRLFARVGNDEVELARSKGAPEKQPTAAP